MFPVVREWHGKDRAVVLRVVDQRDEPANAHMLKPIGDHIQRGAFIGNQKHALPWRDK